MEEYYRGVDENALNKFLEDTQKDVSWDCELVIMDAGLRLAEFGLDSGIDALKKIGIKGENIDELRRQAGIKKTVHNLKLKPKVEQNHEKINFYKMLAQANKRGYKVDSDILLVDWVGILSNIKEENRAGKD
jgi:hypothetical protein